MPVCRLKDQAFMGLVENKCRLCSAVVVVNMAGAAQADGSLYGFFMAVTAANGIIYPVDIKNAVDVKWNRFFNNGQIASFVGECFQVQQIRHAVSNLWV